MSQLIIRTLLLVSLAVCAQAEEALPVVKLKPAMRQVDRDWQFFERIPCSELQSVSTSSDAEQQLLERRRRQCLEKYRAFTPQPVIR